MTDTIKDGGPAFPVHSDFFGHASGMTLRDWFAGQALPVAWDAQDKGYFEGSSREVAEAAYQMADAMLAAREAKP